MAEAPQPMVTSTVIDESAGALYYLAFDLMLAIAPIRDGAVQINESHIARTEFDDPATSSRYAAVRAALLTAYGPSFASERVKEMQRASTLAAEAGLKAPDIPDDDVTTVTLHRDRPTPLADCR